MEIRILEDKKLVEVWLTNKEKEDVQIADYLKGIYGVYRAKKIGLQRFCPAMRTSAITQSASYSTTANAAQSGSCWRNGRKAVKKAAFLEIHTPGREYPPGVLNCSVAGD